MTHNKRKMLATQHFNPKLYSGWSCTTLLDSLKWRVVFCKPLYGIKRQTERERLMNNFKLPLLSQMPAQYQSHTMERGSLRQDDWTKASLEITGRVKEVRARGKQSRWPTTRSKQQVHSITTCTPISFNDSHIYLYNLHPNSWYSRSMYITC